MVPKGYVVKRNYRATVACNLWAKMATEVLVHSANELFVPTAGGEGGEEGWSVKVGVVLESNGDRTSSSSNCHHRWRRGDSALGLCHALVLLRIPVVE